MPFGQAESKNKIAAPARVILSGAKRSRTRRAMSDVSLVEISGKQKVKSHPPARVILSVAELRSSDEHASRDLGQVESKKVRQKSYGKRESRSCSALGSALSH